MKVSDLMTTPARTCRLTDDLGVPSRIMWEGDCGTVPVIDDRDRVVAMITDRDIAMACYLEGRAPQDILVSGIASRTVVSVRPDDELATAEQAMRNAQVRRVPVVDGGGQPLGILSLNDLARNVRRDAKHALGPEPVAATLAAICSPRAAIIGAPV